MVFTENNYQGKVLPLKTQKLPILSKAHHQLLHYLVSANGSVLVRFRCCGR